MDYILVIGLLAAGIFFLYKRLTASNMVETEDFYQQRQITIHYKDRTIKIAKKVFPVDKVTGIATITKTGKYGSNYHIEIDIDDMRNPVHFVPVIGSGFQAEEFKQRICVALRKAGGPDFI